MTTQTTKFKVVSRIYGKSRGWSFTSKDFVDLGRRGSIDVALSNLTQADQIRRISRGLYDYPRYNADLGGKLSPDINQVARAIARQHGMKIVPSGAWAANKLGLSDQVPSKVIYLTDGASRTISIGKMTVNFKHAAPKDLSAKNEISNLVIQALRYLGKDATTEKVIATLRAKLTYKDRKRFLKDARYGIDWIYEAAQKIAAEENPAPTDKVDILNSEN